MSKQQLIEQIRARNRTVTDEFLDGFKEDVLTSYLQRLTNVLGHRGRSSVWVRESCSPAVVTRGGL